MQVSTILRSAVTISAMLAVAASASALDEVPTYHVTRLGPLLEEVFPQVPFPTSRSRGLNENGDLVGEVSTGGSQIQAWVYTVEHGVVPLPLVAGFTSNVALDVSDRDAGGEIVIVGGGVPSTYWDINIGVAALWRFSTVTGEVLETRAIGILPGFADSIALAVNASGTVVGYSGQSGPWSAMKYDVATEVLEPFDFPARPTDLNDAGQVVGGRYRGDLEGNIVDLGIPPGCTSAFLNGLNELGWATGRAGRPFTDGAGHFMVSIVRYTDQGWHVMQPFSHLDNGSDINGHGDMVGDIGVSSALRAALYIAALDGLYLLEDLVAPEFAYQVAPVYSAAINDAGQIGSYSGDAILLTPLGVMIIPGDVNGDVSVDLDDHCAWVADPIDLDGDGDADADDEQWLIDRLLVFGFTVEDCNGNGAGDHCDIIAGLSADCDGNDVPDECQPDCSGDGVPDACEPDCNGNGVPDACDIAEFTSLDCNENGIPDECDGGGITEMSVVYDPPMQMLQDDVIVEEMLVLDAGIVDDVDVTLDYFYRIGYTKVELAHDGTTVTILDRPGHPQYANGFVNFGYVAIVDDDEMGPFLEQTGDYCCNFDTILSPPSYRPDDPLEAFDGMPSQGVWTFTMTTTPDFSPGEGLRGWGLTISRAGAEPGICDCNGNGTPDDEDIAGGESFDDNGNGVPDECEGDPADVNQDGAIDVGDLVAVILSWGPCQPLEPCPADVNGDGVVDVSDLVAVVLGWG